MGWHELNTFVKLPNGADETWFAVFRVSWDAEPEIVGYESVEPGPAIEALRASLQETLSWLEYAHDSDDLSQSDRDQLDAAEQRARQVLDTSR